MYIIESSAKNKVIYNLSQFLIGCLSSPLIFFFSFFEIYWPYLFVLIVINLFYTLLYSQLNFQLRLLIFSSEFFFKKYLTFAKKIYPFKSCLILFLSFFILSFFKTTHLMVSIIYLCLKILLHFIVVPVFCYDSLMNRELINDYFLEISKQKNIDRRLYNQAQNKMDQIFH